MAKGAARTEPADELHRPCPIGQRILHDPKTTRISMGSGPLFAGVPSRCAGAGPHGRARVRPGQYGRPLTTRRGTTGVRSPPGCWRSSPASSKTERPGRILAVSRRDHGRCLGQRSRRHPPRRRSRRDDGVGVSSTRHPPAPIDVLIVRPIPPSSARSRTTRTSVVFGVVAFPEPTASGCGRATRPRVPLSDPCR
jgi:hypothetical protein